MLERFVMAPDAKQALGQAIRSRRVALGLSQEELGAAVDQPQEYISRLERGGTSWPEPEVLGTLAGVLGTTSEDLLREAGYLPVDGDETEMPPAQIFAMAAEKLNDLPPGDREAAVSALQFATMLWRRRHGQSS